MVFPSGRGERPLGLAAAAGGGCEGVRGGGAGGPEAPLSAPLPPRPAQPGEPGAAPSARGAARQDHVGHGRAGQGDPPGLQAVSARRGPEGEAGGRTGRGRGRGRGGVGGWVPPFPCVRAVVMATLPPPPPPGAVRIASSPPPRVAGSVPMDAVCSGPRWAGGGPGGGSAALRPGSCGGAPCGHCRLRGAGSFSGSAAVLRLLTLLSAVHGKSFRLVAWRAGRARVHCRCSETDSGWGGPACGLPALGKGTAQREGPCACEGGRNVRLLNLP